MKFLVIGCNGMAGHMISLYLKEQGHDVTGFARSKSKYVKTEIGDALDLERIKEVISVGKYDTVINCIGLLNQFAESDRANAVFINAFFPHFLAKIAENMETQIIHMSTDCVFSGKTGGYTEDAVRDGTSFYDRSKALGELEDVKNLTLRQSIVGPDIKASGIGLLNWFMQQSGEVNGFTGAMWTGQTTLQLAKTMEAAAKAKIHGLYNMVPDKNISKYELLKLFNHYIKNDELVIHPVEGVVADKTSLRTRNDFDYRIPDYKTMIEELAEWMHNHKEMYPHYMM